VLRSGRLQLAQEFVEHIVEKELAKIEDCGQR